jgi:hypothetical protein
MNYIIEIASFSVVLPLLPALTRFKQYPSELRWICNYVFIGALVELISHLLANARINNLFILHFYVPLSFTALFFFYRQILKTRLRKWIWRGILIFFYLFTLIDSIWLEQLNEINTYTISLANTILITLAILSFYRISTELKVRSLETYPVFWINAGVLFYYSGSSLIFLLGISTHFLSKSIRIYLWSVHALFTILMYVLISIGLWIHNKNKTSTTSSS